MSLTEGLLKYNRSSRMKWISTLSDAATLPQALEDVASAAEQSLKGQKPDLCLVFISSRFLVRL